MIQLKELIEGEIGTGRMLQQSTTCMQGTGRMLQQSTTCMHPIEEMVNKR